MATKAGCEKNVVGACKRRQLILIDHTLKTQTRILQSARRIYTKVARPVIIPWNQPAKLDCTGQAASDAIKTALLGNNPCMVARLGSGELELINTYLSSQKKFTGYINYVKNYGPAVWWDDVLFDYIFQIAGLFPLSRDIMDRFSRLMLEDIQQVDILGSWLRDENVVAGQLSHAVKIGLADIEPYYHPHPWSEVLEGKKVLVIHPFTETIQQQYAKRSELFADARVLPGFHLVTLKAVQSIAGNATGFINWFEALDYMKRAIEEMDFDIAVIGCGAYGLPLAAHIKRLGKKAIHMGGATQAMFGITGRRWEQNAVSKFINKSWVRPSQQEKPANAEKMENGCYW